MGVSVRQSPQRQTRVTPDKQKKNVKTRRGLFTGKEISLFLVMAMIIAYFAVSIIQTETKIFHINNDNVSIQKKISLQTKLNQDLKDEVSRLSMPETIIQKAQSLGLALNDSNLKVAE